jgi:hypothetical protein
MKKYFLLTVLVLPLTLGAIGLMLASLYANEPWRSLAVNLAAGLIGSVITVIYIEKIIRRNEQSQWTKVMIHVGRQVNILANGTTTSLRVALKLRMPSSGDLDKELAVATDPRRMRAVMLSLIEDQLLPQIPRIVELNQKGWRAFANSMLASMKDAERILSLFSKNLDPTVVGLVLDIHEQARALFLYYELWPDILGIPLNELKPNNRGESMVPYFEATYKLIIQNAEKLLKACASLLREIDTRFPDKTPPQS